MHRDAGISRITSFLTVRWPSSPTRVLSRLAWLQVTNGWTSKRYPGDHKFLFSLYLTLALFCSLSLAFFSQLPGPVPIRNINQASATRKQATKENTNCGKQNIAIPRECPERSKVFQMIYGNCWLPYKIISQIYKKRVCSIHPSYKIKRMS